MVAYTEVFAALGNIVALGVGAIFTHVQFFANASEYSWRGAFFFGACIGLVGSVARKSLKEATGFANRQKLIKETFDKNKINWNPDIMGIHSQKPSTTYFMYFLMQCAQPVSMYFAYFYLGELLVDKFGFSHGQMISNNFFVACADFFGLLFLARLSYKIHPFKLLKAKTLICLSIVIFFPIALKAYPSSWMILFFQCVIGMFAFDQLPATPIFYKYMPPFRRFTYSSFFLSSAQLLMYGVLPICSAILGKRYGYNVVLLIVIPTGIAFFASISYFERKEFSKTSLSN
jgi:MHS family proline/betaine transporter-like MFS transporter